MKPLRALKGPWGPYKDVVEGLDRGPIETCRGWGQQHLFKAPRERGGHLSLQSLCKHGAPERAAGRLRGIFSLILALFRLFCAVCVLVSLTMS